MNNEKIIGEITPLFPFEHSLIKNGWTCYYYSELNKYAPSRGYNKGEEKITIGISLFSYENEKWKEIASVYVLENSRYYRLPNDIYCERIEIFPKPKYL